MKRSTLLSIILIVCFVPSLLYAATSNVSTADEFQNALIEAQESNNDTTIYLAAGTYSGNFTYQTTSTGGSKTLTIQPEGELETGDVILDGGSVGRVLYIDSSSQSVDISLERLTLLRGTVTDNGGGLYISTQGDVELNELEVKDNDGSGIEVRNAYEFTLTNSTFSNNSGGYNHGGGALFVHDITSVTLNKNTFTNNTTDGRYSQEGGAVFIYSIGSVILDKNTFSGNYSSEDGGALRINDATATATLAHNIFSNNSCGGWGGGAIIYSRYGNADTITLSNNLIINNYAGGGSGGIDLNDKAAVYDIVNNTIVKNYTNSDLGGGLVLANKGSALRVFNNIIQENENSSGDQDIYADVTIDKLFNNNFSVLSGTASYENANIDEDPSFVSVDDDDYHLNSDSPCVDTGNNLAYDISTKDLEGTDRIINDFVDIGAYEYVGSADNPVCSEAHPELCNCEYDCELVGNAWWKGACYNMSACGVEIDDDTCPQEELDAQFEAGKQYCIDNPEACGISSSDTCDGECTEDELKNEYDKGYISGLAACVNSEEGCATLENNFDITMPCIDIFGTKNTIYLENATVADDPSAIYWKLPLE